MGSFYQGLLGGIAGAGICAPPGRIIECDDPQGYLAAQVQYQAYFSQANAYVPKSLTTYEEDRLSELWANQHKDNRRWYQLRWSICGRIPL